MDGNSFNDWPPSLGSQDDWRHVIVLDDQERQLPNQYMQSYENLSGYGGKHAPQIHDRNTPAIFQSNELSQHNSKLNQYQAPQPTQSSLPLPPGYFPELDGASVGYQPSSINPRDLSLLHTSWETPSITSSMTSSASFDMPALTSASSTSRSSHKFKTIPSHKNFYPSKLKPRRLPSSKSSSSFSDSPIKQRKSNAGKTGSGTAQPRRAMAQFEEALKSKYPKLSKSFQQQSQLLLAQFKLLMEKEIEDGNLDAEFDEMSLTTPSTQDSSVSSEVLDSGYPTEAASSVSSTPRPQNLDTQDAMPMDAEPEERVRYYCTFPTCKVPQKDCKYVHKKCQCPVKRERYWSDSKVDIKRHEEGEKHWPQETYICLQCFVTDEFGDSMCSLCFMPLPGDFRAHYLQCERARANTKTFGRKDHLLGHLQKQHGLKDMGELTKTWSIPVDSDWPRQCGFCGVIFDSWDERMMHVAGHFEKGSKIQDWRLPFRGPKDTKPPGPYQNYKKDEDDDDNDDFGGGGHSGGKIFGNGFSIVPPQQSQHGQSSSSQEYGQYFQQDYYQQGYRAAPSHLSRGSNQAETERQRTGSLGRHVKFSLALERYLKDPGDRVPGLGTAPRVTNRQSIRQSFGYLPSSPFASSRKAFMMPVRKRVEPFGKDLVLFQHLPRSFLARQYIYQHWNELDHGILWVNSKIRPEVKDSLWDIAARAVLEYPKFASHVAGFFQTWWQNSQHDLRGLPLPAPLEIALPSLRPWFSRGLVDTINWLHHDLHIDGRNLTCCHVDLKLDNILVDELYGNGHERWPVCKWKISDFGICSLEEARGRSKTKILGAPKAPKESLKALTSNTIRIPAKRRSAVYQTSGYDATPFSDSVANTLISYRSILNYLADERHIEKETEQPVILTAHSCGGLIAKHALQASYASTEKVNTNSAAPSMEEWRRSASLGKFVPKDCDKPGCEKPFIHLCNLAKHESSHSRPWKCPAQTCKYHETGWPTEKEMDRHYNDKHSAPRSYTRYKLPGPKVECSSKENAMEGPGWKQIRTNTDAAKQLTWHRTDMLRRSPSYQSQEMKRRRRRAKKSYHLAEHRERGIGNDGYGHTNPGDSVQYLLNLNTPLTASTREMIHLIEHDDTTRPSSITGHRDRMNARFGQASTTAPALTRSLAQVVKWCHPSPDDSREYPRVRWEHNSTNNGILNGGVNWTGGHLCGLHSKHQQHDDIANLDADLNRPLPLVKNVEDKSRRQQIGNFWLQERLRHRDAVFVVDVAESMAKNGQLAIEILKILTSKLNDDNDGVDLEFQGAASVRSVLLEEFRPQSNLAKRYELKDIYEHVVELSSDQQGAVCRKLRESLAHLGGNSFDTQPDPPRNVLEGDISSGPFSYTFSDLHQTSHGLEVGNITEDAIQDQEPQLGGPIYDKRLDKYGRAIIFPDPSEIVIVVMGFIGVGKSTFIHHIISDSASNLPISSLKIGGSATAITPAGSGDHSWDHSVRSDCSDERETGRIKRFRDTGIQNFHKVANSLETHSRANKGSRGRGHKRRKRRGKGGSSWEELVTDTDAVDGTSDVDNYEVQEGKGQSQTKVKRKGALSSRDTENIKRIRLAGACWSCYLKKASCLQHHDGQLNPGINHSAVSGYHQRPISEEICFNHGNELVYSRSTHEFEKRVDQHNTMLSPRFKNFDGTRQTESLAEDTGNSEETATAPNSIISVIKASESDLYCESAFLGCDSRFRASDFETGASHSQPHLELDRGQNSQGIHETLRNNDVPPQVHEGSLSERDSTNYLRTPITKAHGDSSSQLDSKACCVRGTTYRACAYCEGRARKRDKCRRCSGTRITGSPCPIHAAYISRENCINTKSPPPYGDKPGRSVSNAHSSGFHNGENHVRDCTMTQRHLPQLDPPVWDQRFNKFGRTVAHDDIKRYGVMDAHSRPDPEVDIVLVHGLNGDPRKTWTVSDGVFWLTTLFPPALKTGSYQDSEPPSLTGSVFCPQSPAGELCPRRNYNKIQQCRSSSFENDSSYQMRRSLVDLVAEQPTRELDVTSSSFRFLPEDIHIQSSASVGNGNKRRKLNDYWAKHDASSDENVGWVSGVPGLGRQNDYPASWTANGTMDLPRNYHVSDTRDNRPIR